MAAPQDIQTEGSSNIETEGAVPITTEGQTSGSGGTGCGFELVPMTGLLLW